MTRLELCLGAPVVRDGRDYGVLDGVILAGERARWEALLVRRRLTPWSERLLPRSAVRDATDKAVTADRPPTTFTRLPSARVVRRRAPVRTMQGHGLGRVALVLADCDGQVLHLVVQRRPLEPRLMIPAASLVSVATGLVVDLSAEAVRALQRYYPDTELAAAAWEAIESFLLVAGLEEPFIRLQVSDGVATLTGHTSSRMRSHQVEAAVCAVPGVLGVANRLVGDDALAIAVADALAADPLTRPTIFDLDVSHGVVTLRSEAPDGSTAEAATAVAASVPAVRGVVNRSVAPGFTPDTAWVEPPGVGDSMFADDEEVGTVERVVIDPRRRRFLGAVVAARVPENQDPYAMLVERTVFVPAEQIRDVTETAVFVAGRALDVARGPLAAERTVPAAADWQPPFPYRHEDVVWPAGAREPAMVPAARGV